jgi:hypothetical protein
MVVGKKEAGITKAQSDVNNLPANNFNAINATSTNNNTFDPLL